MAWSDVIGRNHPWAVGDAFAWGERELDIPAVLVAAVGHLIGMRAPIDLQGQLVHGDLCGNILSDSVLTPAVIDVSSYWRPKRYADAVMVAEAMVWHGAGEEALERFVDPIGVRTLVRALLFGLGRRRSSSTATRRACGKSSWPTIPCSRQWTATEERRHRHDSIRPGTG